MQPPYNYKEAREQCMEIIGAIRILSEHPAVRTTKGCADRTEIIRRSINDIYMMLGAEMFVDDGNKE